MKATPKPKTGVKVDAKMIMPGMEDAAQAAAALDAAAAGRKPVSQLGSVTPVAVVAKPRYVSDIQQ